METFEKGYCVHKDHGVVSFVYRGRAMKLATDGRIVIFTTGDRVKLRPIARKQDLEKALVAMNEALKSRVRNLEEWRTVKPGSNFVKLCRVVAEMTRCIRTLTEDQARTLQKLKKHVDIELSLLYHKEGRVL